MPAQTVHSQHQSVVRVWFKAPTLVAHGQRWSQPRGGQLQFKTTPRYTRCKGSFCAKRLRAGNA
jgi:hypothetical protein